MNRRDRKAAVAKAKAEGMNRRDRKALGRKLRADNLTTRATEEAELDYLRKRKNNRRPEDLLRSDDWQAVGQRKRDLIEGQKRFNESEAAALLTTRPYLGRKKWFSEYTSDKYRI